MKDVREALADAALEAQKEVKELEAENKKLIAGIDKINNVGVQLRRKNKRLKGLLKEVFPILHSQANSECLGPKSLVTRIYEQAFEGKVGK